MKKLFLVLLMGFAAIYTSAFAEDKYMDAMTNAVGEIKNAKTAEDMQDLSNTFERIAAAEPTQWLPNYYAAYTLMIEAFLLKENNEKEKIYDKAIELVMKADKISPNNTEILTLKAFVLSMKISLDPMKYGMKLGMEVNKLLAEALKLNANNPRANMLKAENLYYTPPQFGGDPVKACEAANKTLELFNQEKPATAIDPSWGKDEIERLIGECSKAK